MPISHALDSGVAARFSSADCPNQFDRRCSDRDAATSPPPNHTVTRSPFAITVGSQITFESHAWSPAMITRKLLPAHAVARTRQAQPPHFIAIAPGVQHPVISARGPNRRFAQSLLVERAVIAQFQDRIRAQLRTNSRRRATSRRPAAAAARDPVPDKTCSSSAPARIT